MVLRKSRFAGLATLSLLVVSAIPLRTTDISVGLRRSQATAVVGKQLAELEDWDTARGDEFGAQVDVSSNTAVVGSGIGKAYVFMRSGPAWQEASQLRGSDTVKGDGFGESVAVSGASAVIGAAGRASDAGRVYVFTETPARWKQTAELKGSDTVKGDYFGGAVAISGNTIVVGSVGSASTAGRVYVFTRNASGWSQTAELKGSDTAKGDFFGESLTISGAAVVVGVSHHGLFAGRAYVFAHSTNGWHQTAELQGADTVFNDSFGSSVSISGTTVVVGASGAHNYAGRAYVFTKATSGWKQTGELKGSDTAALDAFGDAVSVSGSTIAIGSMDHGSDAGRAYVFTRFATGWDQTAELKGADTRAGDRFGVSVAISGSTIVVGAMGHAHSSGRVYVFGLTAARLS